jgi:hypothetical protein
LPERIELHSVSEPTVWKRNKTIAVLLAIFFGPWTWLYTYRRDPGKAAFGLGLSISLLTIWMLMYVQFIIRRPPPNSNVGEGLGYSFLGLLQILFSIWVLAVIFAAGSKYTLEGPEKRAKTTAILLAIFLGPWTWLYTYKKDHWKFFPSILIDLGGWAAWALLPEQLSSVVHSFWLPAFLAIWLIAVITSAVRKSEWYRKFGCSLTQ